MSNLFDLMCRLIEAHPERLAPIRPFFERAGIFAFEQILDAQSAPDVKDLLKEEYPFGEEFFLPFPTTAILAPNTLIILQDTVERATGLIQPREFLMVGSDVEEVAPPPATGRADSVDAVVNGILGQPNPVNRPAQTAAASRRRYLGAFTGIVRDLANVNFDPATKMTHWKANMEAHYCCLFTEDCRDLRTWAVQSTSEVPPQVWHSLLESLRHIATVNTPARFIVEETTEGAAKQAKKLLAKSNPRLLRTGLRPQYTLLRPSEIRTIRGDVEPPVSPGTHASPVPHMRRQHTRTLRSPRFVQKQGHVLKIAAKWIGDSEFRKGNKHYKVLLDK